MGASPKSSPSSTRRQETPPRTCGRTRSTHPEISDTRAPSTAEADLASIKRHSRPREVPRSPPTSAPESSLSPSEHHEVRLVEKPAQVVWSDPLRMIRLRRQK